MLKDHYENDISTPSATARDAYDSGIQRLLEGQVFILDAFEEAVSQDPGFALGFADLARARHYAGDGTGAREAISTAKKLNKGLTSREASHIDVFSKLIEGRASDAYDAIRTHVVEYPRDAIVAQTCSSIFGLIGFSGQPGREAEMLAFNTTLLPHYGEDWWCLSQYAFALCETGQLDKAEAYIDRSLALNPANSNGAHVRAHIQYEQGDAQGGIDYLANWITGYDRSAVLHGHLSWHVALWSLQQGDIDRMWSIVDTDVAPGNTLALPINVLTDTASILYRAEVAGVAVSADRWKVISDYAAKLFPRTGNAFIDVHAALAHAMAGNSEYLSKIIENPAGPAADLVPDLACGYREIAAGDWVKATQFLMRAMADHARIGGSRAQRDLLEQTLLTCLLRQDRAQEARDIIALRRPILSGSAALN